MEIILIMIFVFSLQNICFAADSEAQDNISDLSKTHNSYYHAEKRRTIFYPNIYPNYESFQGQNITNLLSERLKILIQLKDLYGKWMIKKMSDSEFDELKFNLENNEVAILSNCSNDLLEFVFGKDYNRDCIQTNHIVNVAVYLKSRLLEPSFKEIRTKLDNLIESIQSNQENEGQFFAIGKKSFLYLKK